MNPDDSETSPLISTMFLGAQRLRIAMFAPGAALPSPPSHSVTRVLETLARGLVERGHRVSVFAPASSRVVGELVPIGHKPILLEEDPDCRLLRAAQQEALSELRARAAEFDIAHAHSLDIPGVLYSADLLEDLELANVTTLHSCIEVPDYTFFSDCRNNIVTCSENQRHACPTMRVVATVHHGLDPSPFPVIETPDDYLCYLGRIDRAKQPHLAIQLAIQRNMRIRLAGPVGDTSRDSYFVREVQPLLSHPLVEFLGEIAMENKTHLLAQARCNLHPTGFREPFGLTVIEAAFCGTPTLAIRRGALPEIITDGINGVLVEDFTEGCHRLEDCFELDRKLIAKVARTRFHYLAMTDKYVQVYHRVISSPARRT
jgi:glycosyltransferase involved in cell wall biosynthesis